ncbi:hypothetical protein Q3H58_001806 [Pseudomonas psychrotolerans]|nr:hypothetical protein [Pseudomonas psychrotolerans]
MGPLVRLGLGIDHVDLGVGSVGDPGLAAVEHEAIAPLLGAQAHGHHVGAGVGLTHGQGADVLAAEEFGQIAALLFRAAVAVDLVDAQVGMGAVGQGHGAGAAAEFFHHHHVGQVAEAGAAVRLGDGDPEQAQVAELAPEIVGEGVVAVDGSGAGRHLGGDELADLVTQEIQGLAEGEVQAGIVQGAPPSLLLSVGEGGWVARTGPPPPVRYRPGPPGSVPRRYPVPVASAGCRATAAGVGHGAR